MGTSVRTFGDRAGRRAGRGLRQQLVLGHLALGGDDGLAVLARDERLARPAPLSASIVSRPSKASWQ